MTTKKTTAKKTTTKTAAQLDSNLVPPVVQTAGAELTAAYAGLEAAQTTVAERVLAFLAALAVAKIPRKNANAVYRATGAPEKAVNAFKVWCSENGIKADEKTGLVKTNRNGKVMFTPKATTAKKRAAQTPAAPAAPAAPAEKLEEPTEESKGDKLAVLERAERMLLEACRGLAIPADAMTVDEVIRFAMTAAKKAC